MRVRQNFEDDFADGFASAAPEGYDLQRDRDTSDPWCCPWYSQPLNDWFDASLSAYDMGKAWAESIHDDLAEHLAEAGTTEDD